MALAAQRLFIVLVCIGLLAIEAEVVCGLRGRDIILGLEAEKARILINIATVDLGTKKKSASAPSSFDSNRASKRRVRRGSDPIHNRS